MRKEKAWEDSNVSKCYIKLIDHVKYCLDRKKLPNEFNTSENILKGKDPEVLKELSKAWAKRKDELLHINQ